MLTTEEHKSMLDKSTLCANHL